MRIIQNAAESMSGNRLFSDYINNFAKVREFYPSHFREEASWQKVMERGACRKRDHNELARILRRQNIALGAGKAAIDNIDKLMDGKVFSVVTGQQVGIFTGPLYTIYKAITVVKLARHLCEKYDADFVPVFWMESNDHDIAEANHINLLDSESELVKVEYMPGNYKPGCSMKDVLIDDGFLKLASALESRLPNTEFKRDIFQIIQASYLLSQNLTNGFGRMMAHLLSKYGMILLDPSDPDIKNLLSYILEHEVRNPLESMKMVNSAGGRLKSYGYESQIEKSSDSTGLFMEENGIRRKLLFQDGRFRLDGDDATWDSHEMLSLLRTEPWRFSPNVALRPIAQDYILPTIAYVAGPGEISYFAQLADVYASMGVNMPVIYPRASLTIVETKVERIMEKNGLDVRELSEHYEKLFSRLSKDIAAEKLGRLLKSSKSKINDTFEKLASDLAEFDPDLKNIAESIKGKIDHQISILEERAYKVQRSRNDIMREQIKRACMNIFPDGNPQERMFNIVQYLVLYGLQFVDDIMSLVDA